MRYFILIFLGFAFSCKTSSLSYNELSKALKTELNPILDELKLIIIDYKIQKRFWPNDLDDFNGLYTDEHLLFDQFKKLEFKSMNDSLLIVDYHLKKNYKLQHHTITHLSSDVKLDSLKPRPEIPNGDNESYLTYNNLEEGRLVFHGSDTSVEIIHYYKGGKVTQGLSLSKK